MIVISHLKIINVLKEFMTNIEKIQKFEKLTAIAFTSYHETVRDLNENHSNPYKIMKLKQTLKYIEEVSIYATHTYFGDPSPSYIQKHLDCLNILQPILRAFISELTPKI